MLGSVSDRPDQPVGVRRGQREEVVLLPERDRGAVEQVLDVEALGRGP